MVISKIELGISLNNLDITNWICYIINTTTDSINSKFLLCTQLYLETSLTWIFDIIYSN